MADEEAQQLPEDDLSFTFNGVLCTSVNLVVKTHPVFLYTEQGGFINKDQIPEGGYQLMVGEFGVNLGNIFIIYTKPLSKNFTGFWDTRADAFMIKMSLPKENGVLLNLYR